MDSGSACSGSGQQAPATLPGASPPAPKAPLCRWGTRAPRWLPGSPVPPRGATPRHSWTPAPSPLCLMGLSTLPLSSCPAVAWGGPPARSEDSITQRPGTRPLAHGLADAPAAGSSNGQGIGPFLWPNLCISTSLTPSQRRQSLASDLHRPEPPPPRACSPAPTPARPPYGVNCQPACVWPCVFSRSLEDVGEMGLQESLGPGSHLQHKGGSAVGSPCLGQDTGTTGQKSRMAIGSAHLGGPALRESVPTDSQVPCTGAAGACPGGLEAPPTLPSASKHSQLQVWKGQVPETAARWALGCEPPEGRPGGSGALLCYI